MSTKLLHTKIEKIAASRPAAVISGTYAGLKNIANFAYGIGAASYSAHCYFEGLWAEYGVADTVFHTISPFGFIISGIGALDALNNIRQNCQSGCAKDSRNVVHLLKLAASGALFTAAYTHPSEAVTFATSTTLSYLSGCMALLAFTKMIRDAQRHKAACDALKEYMKPKENPPTDSDSDIATRCLAADEITLYVAMCYKTESELKSSIMRCMGWISLCLAHIPALAAASPVLAGVGAAFLVAGGAYAFYTACENMNSSMNDVFPEASRTKKVGFWLPVREHTLNRRLDSEITNRNKM